jgi:hypothetical protein
VSSWSAFEIFAGGLFAQRYAGTPRQARRPPPLRQRFEAIATDLDPENAPADLALFDSTYRIRNDLFHEVVFVDLRQPCHDAQKLARKYIRLYYGTVPMMAVAAFRRPCGSTHPPDFPIEVEPAARGRR